MTDKTTETKTETTEEQTTTTTRPLTNIAITGNTEKHTKTETTEKSEDA